MHRLTKALEHIARNSLDAKKVEVLEKTPEVPKEFTREVFEEDIIKFNNWVTGIRGY